MSLREYVTVIFSKELSTQDTVKQREAVLRLKDYVQAHKGIWEVQSDFAIEETFEPFLGGGLELNKIILGRLSMVFQAEVIGGRLSESEQAEIRKLGFAFLRHNPPLYEQ